MGNSALVTALIFTIFESMLKKLLVFVFFPIMLLAQYNDDQNRYMLGQSYESAGDLEKSKVIYEDLYNRNPENPVYFDALNKIYVALKNYDGSIRIISNKLNKNPMDINLYGLLGSTYYLKGEEEKAYNTWDEGIKKAPDNFVTYKVMANYALERRLFDKALEFLKKGKKLNDNPLVFSYDLANLYVITMRYDDAAREYMSLIQKDPGQFPAVQQRIIQYATKPEAINPTIQIFEKERNEDNLPSARMLAFLYTKNKQYDKAFELYKDIEKKQNTKGMELFNFAQTLFTGREYEMASKIYNYLLENYSSSPVYPAVKLGHARSLESDLLQKSENNDWKTFSMTTGTNAAEAQKVISAYKDIINSYPHSDQSLEALYRMGILQYEYLNNIKDAESVLSSVEQQYPGSHFAVLSMQELAHIYIADNQLDKSYELLNKLINSGIVQGEDLNDIRYTLARVNFYKGNFEDTRKLLNDLVTEFKDDNSNDAISLSMLLNTSMNDSSNIVKYAEAEFLAEQKKFQQAKEIYDAVGADQQAFLLASNAKIRAAEMDIALDNYDGSIKQLEQISQEKEKNIFSDKSLYLLGNIYQYAKKDKNKAIEIYERLLAEFPNSMYLDDAREQINVLKNKIS